MSRHHNIVIVCDHGRKGDGRIEHERCDLVAPIIWVDETQGWLPQAPAVATLLDDDNQPRAVIGLPPNESRYDLKCAATGGCGCTGNSPA